MLCARASENRSLSWLENVVLRPFSVAHLLWLLSSDDDNNLLQLINDGVFAIRAAANLRNSGVGFERFLSGVKKNEEENETRIFKDHRGVLWLARSSLWKLLPGVRDFPRSIPGRSDEEMTKPPV